MSDNKLLHEEFNNEHDFISEAIPQLFTHVSACFDGLIEGSELYSFSIQLTSNGEYRFVARATRIGKSGDPTGIIAYGSAETFADALASFETCLRFGNLGWRKDKYFKPTGHRVNQETALKRVTIEGLK